MRLIKTTTTTATATYSKQNLRGILGFVYYENILQAIHIQPPLTYSKTWKYSASEESETKHELIKKYNEIERDSHNIMTTVIDAIVSRST